MGRPPGGNHCHYDDDPGGGLSWLVRLIKLETRYPMAVAAVYRERINDGLYVARPGRGRDSGDNFQVICLAWFGWAGGALVKVRT